MEQKGYLKTWGEELGLKKQQKLEIKINIFLKNLYNISDLNLDECQFLLLDT